MISRNEQFVCFTAVLAVALPVLMWFRYVGPLRSGIAADEQAVSAMRVTLSNYVEAELMPASESDRSQAIRVAQTHGAFAALMNQSVSVSEMYQGIELAASGTRISVSKIEPSRNIQQVEFQGPLKTDSIRAEYRNYRIEIVGPAADLSVFLERLQLVTGSAVIREVRAQYSSDERSGRAVAATVTLDSITMIPVEASKKGGGK